MIGVIIIGACGRMGSAIAGEIKELRDVEILYGVERTGHPNIGLPFGKNFITDNLEAVIRKGDVVVDFSQVEAVLRNREIIIGAKKPYLCGVTGFSEDQFKELKAMGEHIPFLYSPNFSFGVNLLAKLIGDLAGRFPKDYDIQMIEVHHKEKKDAPSGTAKMLVKSIEKVRSEPVAIFSLRAGEIVGEHKIIFAGPGEVLEVTHSALSRKAFVKGVLAGIRFIITQPKGFYTFEDLLRAI